jgi:hypothetical protein
MMAYIYLKVSDLKNRARRIAREENLPRHEALDEAARRGGFQNYMHALRQLPDQASAPVGYPVEIMQRWFVRKTREHGTARVTVSLAKPLTDVVKPQHFIENLGGCRLDGDSLIVSDGWTRDGEQSVHDIGKIARTLQLMDATGFKPSRARRCYPKGEWDNRPPIADHDNCWFDHDAKAHILSTEPYPGRAEWRDPQQKAWEEKHGWATIRVNWGSVYGHGTELYLLCPDAYAPTLRAKVAVLEASPSAISDDDLDAGAEQRAA